MKNAVRVIMAIGVLSLMAITLTACDTKTFNLESITMIEFTDGNNGNIVEITDLSQIQSLIQPFNDNEFKRGESSQNQTGWSYRLRFFQDDKQITEIDVMSSSRIVFNGSFYDVADGTIDLYHAMTGLYLLGRNNAHLLISENSIVVMENRSENEALFDGLQTGDRIAIIHGLIRISNPESTDVYYYKLLEEGSIQDIPNNVYEHLRGMGWVD